MSRLAQLKSALPALALEACERTREFEAARQLADDYVDRVKTAGAHLVLIPERDGGLGGSLRDWFDMGLTLAEADASTGWVSMHGAGANALLYALADRRFVATHFADPMASAAWTNAPSDLTCDETSDGYRISCRWAFGTGCTGATHVGGLVPSKTADGTPRSFAALMPLVNARIDRTWDPIGLGGTGSHDIVFENVLVPRHHTFTWPDGVPTSEYPLAIVSPGSWFIGTCAAAVQLGLARHAIDEARRVLIGKIDRSVGGPILAHPAVMRTLESAEGLLFALRASLHEVLAEIWSHALAGQPLSIETRMRARLANVTAVQHSATLVRNVFDCVGTVGAKRSGLLEQLYRDAACLPQQIAVNAFTYETVGRVRGGFPMTGGRL